MASAFASSSISFTSRSILTCTLMASVFSSPTSSHFLFRLACNAVHTLCRWLYVKRCTRQFSLDSRKEKQRQLSTSTPHVDDPDLAAKSVVGHGRRQCMDCVAGTLRCSPVLHSELPRYKYSDHKDNPCCEDNAIRNRVLNSDCTAACSSSHPRQLIQTDKRDEGHSYGESAQRLQMTIHWALPLGACAVRNSVAASLV